VRRSSAWARSAARAVLLAASVGSPPGAAALDERILEVRINGVVADPGGIVRITADGGLLVAAEDASRWRLLVDESRLVADAGESYLRLDAVPGIQAELDTAGSQLNLIAEPAALVTAEHALGSSLAPRPEVSGSGAFVNYDLLLQQATVESGNGAQLRLGAFGRFGLLTSEHALSSAGEESALRLMSTLRRDFPDSMTTLRIGDFASAPGSFGRAALLGGVQWGTNFGLQPGLVTFPFQSLAGEAALPSTVDVYLNGALRDRIETPAGPFEIAQIPVVTGQGTLRMVVSDALGRSVAIEQPFFASARMLRPGLHEQSWELGALREDYGIASNRYGRAVAITTHRWGLNDRLTAEMRAEVLRDQGTVAAGLATSAGSHGILLAGLAYGGGPDAAGGRALLGYQGQWGAFSLGAEVTYAETAFRQVGDGAGPIAPPSTLAALNLGWSDERAGSLGLAIVAERSRSGEDSEVVNLSWSRQLGARGLAALTYFEDFAGEGRRGVSLTYMQSIGDRTSSSLTMNQEDGESARAVAEVQRALDRDPGWGWRLRADERGDGSAELAWQRERGIYRAGGDSLGGEARAFVAATGGLVWYSGAVLPARRVESAFGLVRVPGMAGVRVYFENELFGVTDERGELLLPALRPYQANEIRIEVEDLPFDAVVATDRRVSVPYFGSGVVIEFPARIERSATMNLRLPDGRPVPAGARLQIAGAAGAPVGEDGYAFVSVPAGRSRLLARWGDGVCDAWLEFPAGEEALPHLGEIDCRPPAAQGAP
jgi:outer membrane usher protein